MMKKILLSGLLSSTMLLAIPFEYPLVNGEATNVNAGLSCTDAPMLSSDNLTPPDYINPDPKAFAKSVVLKMGLPGKSTDNNGKSIDYGWVSFELPVASKVKVTGLSYNLRNDEAAWFGLFNSECTGKVIATTTGRGANAEVVLKAGVYKLAVNNQSEYATVGTSIEYTPVEEVGEYTGDPALQQNQHLDAEISKKRVGGKTMNDATLLAGTTALYTLHLTHATSWKGKAQRYGYYSFDIEEDKHSQIEFTAPDSGGSWIGIYNENGTLVANKWTAKGTSGTIKVDLPKGNYRFFINKSGDAVGNAMIHFTNKF